MNGFLVVATLAILAAVGRLLLPRGILPESKLARLAIPWGYGLVFLTGIMAWVILGRMNYISWLSICQLIGLAAARWLMRNGAGDSTSTADPDTGWTRREVTTALFTGLLLLVLLQLPCRFFSADGHVMRFNKDWAFFVEMVLALPESRAANGWSIFMGEHTIAATGYADMWYHWGPLLFAAGLRGLTGLPAAQVLLIVANTVFNAILLAALAAFVRSLCRLPVWQCLLAGGVALLSVHFLRLLPEAFNLLGAWLPFDIFHHVRMPLATMFAYKYEAVLLFTALLLWQGGRKAHALGMIYLAACSAPHTVAFLAPAAATLAALGAVWRDRSLLRIGASVTAALLGGWATVHFAFQTDMTGGKATSHASFTGIDKLIETLRFGLLDSAAMLVVTIFFVAGCVFLIRHGRAVQDETARVLGWLALCGLVGSLFAFHALSSPDKFHIVIMSHSVLIMPVGACGLLWMAVSTRGRHRLLAMALYVSGAALGVHTLLSNDILQGAEAWKLSDVQTLHQHLRGRPFGYLARNDRDWWIPKLCPLGAVLDSRCVRLNPLDESKSAHFNPKLSRIPLEWMPPRKDESPVDWSLRLAKALGIRHIIETWQDPLPSVIRARLKPLHTAPGLFLYEIDEPAAAPSG